MKRPVSSSLRNASTFVEHKPCPACRETGGDRAGDNLSVYSDGHGYCNACGHYQKDVTGDNIKVNANGIPITYENKDELSAEDIESAGADK